MADRGTPSWPKVTIRLYDAHNGEVKIAGRSHPLVAADPREAAIALVAERAAQLGRPIKATAVEPDGNSWPLIIHPNGEVDALDPNGAAKKPLWPILVAAGVALALVAGTLVYLLVIRDTTPVARPPSTSPTLPPLPTPQIKSDTFDARPLPAGFTGTAAWSVDVAEGTNPAVSRDETKVAILTPDQKIAMLGAGGKVIWQFEVPEKSENPVFTKIDGKDVVASVTEDGLMYWPVNGGFPTTIEIPSDVTPQFFGHSPLLVTREGKAWVIVEGKLVEIGGKPRRATFLLADGKRALMAGYFGPLWWGEPNKEPVEVTLKPPTGSTKIDHVVVASPGFVIVQWMTKDPEKWIPAVHSPDTGSVLATCPPTGSTVGDWVPDPNRKVAALGNCVIDFAARKSRTIESFQPLSLVRSGIYGKGGGSTISVVGPGTSKPVSLPEATVRPWGIVAGHAIVMHESVLYALAPKTK